MVTTGGLSKEALAKILEARTYLEKNERFLDWITDANDESTYDVFLSSLDKTDQEHVADFLRHNGGITRSELGLSLIVIIY